MVLLLGRWCSWQACGAPDRPVVPLLGLWCPWRACGAPVRPVVSLIGRWCPWQACGAPGPQGGGSWPMWPPPLDPPLELRMLNIATGYSKNTLSCSELNEEHAGEGFRSLRHILTPLWACKAKKCHFSQKFDLWPDLTRSNIDLVPKTICAIARSRRGASTGLFREALRPSGADRQGGGSYQPPPPWPSALWEMPWPGEG